MQLSAAAQELIVSPQEQRNRVQRAKANRFRPPEEIRQFGRVYKLVSDEPIKPEKPAPLIPVHPVAKIIRMVSGFYGVSVNDIVSARRELRCINTRHVAIWLARNLTNTSLPEIGRRFGGRDHSTIHNAIRRVERLRSTDNEMQSAISAVQAQFNREPS